MSGRRRNARPAVKDGFCIRCASQEASITVRAEALCTDCFSKYVHTKIIKRMEAFRVRHSAVGHQRTLLLPISFGVSSLTLLNILDQHLQAQKQRTGRTGFRLHVVHIATPSTDQRLVESVESGRMKQLQDRYPDHAFSMIQLADIFDHGDVSTELGDELVIGNSNGNESHEPKQVQLERLLASATSATSRADILSILRTRLTVNFAKASECEAIIWGDSTTRLAEKTLAEVAKGRGFALPWHVADGPSPHGVAFHYPVRDLLKKELTSHAELMSPPLTALVLEARTQAPVNSKNTTIDELMKQYFESVEQNYPSIVANVVRTTSKLNAPQPADEDVSCKLCGMPVARSALGIDNWGGNQSEQIDHAEGTDLCCGCTRVLPQDAGDMLPG